MNDWFCTASGKRVYVTAPSPSDICIEDIAHGLSHVCRFGGHVRQFYSVAQHSVIVSHYAGGPLRLPALLHDASEAYLGDIIHPLKQCLPDYKAIEKLWEVAIEQAFGLEVDELDRALIKSLDLAALVTERRDVACHGWEQESAHNRWIVDEMGIQAWPEVIEPMSPEIARRAFLDAFAAASDA